MERGEILTWHDRCRNLWGDLKLAILEDVAADANLWSPLISWMQKGTHEQGVDRVRGGGAVQDWEKISPCRCIEIIQKYVHYIL